MYRNNSLFYVRVNRLFMVSIRFRKKWKYYIVWMFGEFIMKMKKYLFRI